MILLDTHALIWMDPGREEFGPIARRLIQGAWDAGEICVSAVSFWECAVLVAKRRLILALPPKEWRAQLLADGIVEIPLDGDIGVMAVPLTLSRKDPADRFIVATALARGADLMTADQELLAWRNPLKRHDARR